MRVCGVICEYDPFHRGHERHLRLAREKTGADYILCVMSGFYTQRGMPSLLPPDVRAHMALLCGADAVVQMPFAFSLREGDGFALGGVEILHKLDCVDFLSFGCETENVAFLQKAAERLAEPDAAFENTRKEAMQQGLSYAAAQGIALKNALGNDAETLKGPNAALALGYLKAVKKLKSDIEPCVVLRSHDYHAGEIEEYPSATAVRQAILRGDWKSVEESIPKPALPILMNAVSEGRLCQPESVDIPLRLALLQLGEEGIRKLPGVDEGLECRILQAVREETTRLGILQRVKTRRYTLGRISRALCAALLHMEKDSLPEHPECVQILGFRESARPLLKKMQEGDIPLVMKAAKEEKMQRDRQAADVWQTLCARPMGEHYRQGPVIFRDGKEEK